MNIERKHAAGQDDCYILENDHGMQVQIGLMGAAIERILLPDADGNPVNVALSFANSEDYRDNTLFAGATVGPVAGRIEGSTMEIDGHSYPLTANENGITCLHGGSVNASFQTWDVTQACADETRAVLGLSLMLPDGLEGFPGSRHLNTVYELDNNGTLTIRYDGVTDKATYLSMTNHTYFNLSGNFSESGLLQRLTVPADRYLRTDERNIPTDLVSVEGTPYDFREEHPIREVLDAWADHSEIRKARGLDNAFDVRQAAAAGEPIVTLRDEGSGRTLKITSPTAQCVVVYTGGFIGDSYMLADGVRSSDSCAVALECQAFPNAIHHADWEPVITRPGEVYRHEIQYHFSIEPGSEHPESEHPESEHPESEHLESEHPESKHPKSEKTERVILETERLILRPWKESDAENLYQYARDPEVGPIAGWPPHKNPEESLDVIRHVLCGQECYAVCLKGSDVTVGCIELRLNGHTDMTKSDDECELGYWLGRPYWGRGIMPEAATELIRHGFEEIGMKKIWCGYYDGNTKSKRVQEKLGFCYQWTTPDVDVPLMHEKRIGHVNCMTREEWEQGCTKIVRLIDRPELRETMAAWFHSKWRIPLAAYRESMEECLSKRSAVPQWYAALRGDRIVGGLGVIDNDFHDRKDLTPNVCAVYVEEKYRCRGIAGRLLQFVCEDMRQRGINTLYLVTDHTSFYERYGWEFLCMVQGDGEPEQTRMYVHRSV